MFSFDLQCFCAAYLCCESVTIVSLILQSNNKKHNNKNDNIVNMRIFQQYSYYYMKLTSTW